MPDKHIRISESCIGLGAFILTAMTKPRTIDQLWNIFNRARKNKKYPSAHRFENIIIAMDMLYAVGAIQEVTDKEGWYEKCDC